MITIQPQDSRPIWRQIQEGVRYRVALGELSPSNPLPSVRDLAKQLQVNPATVSKAYRQLVAEGVLVVRRGEGTFPAPSVPKIPKAERRARLREAAERLAAVGRTVGADRRETEAALAAALDAIRSADPEVEADAAPAGNSDADSDKEKR